MLGRRVGKTASYTRWDARPLTGEQLSYAAEDVVHLLELADELQRRLDASGRLEWAREECHRIETASDERDPLTAWERLPRVGQLDPRSRAVARSWRRGVSVRRRPRTSRSTRCSATRRWSSWPSASPAPPTRSARSAGCILHDPPPGHRDPGGDRDRTRGFADPARGGPRTVRGRRRSAHRPGRSAPARAGDRG